MSHADIFGAPTSCSADALVGINDFAEGFVRYQKRSANVMKTAKAHPECGLANIYTGILWMFLERPEAPQKALPFIQQAQACTGLNHREKGLLSMLEAWQAYDFDKAIKCCDEVLKEYPADLSTLKIAQYHLFNKADSKGMLALAQRCLPANQDRAAVHSMVAFGHEQCHQIDEAERSAQRALAIESTEPWAHHALAHVHLSRGSIDEGKQFLSAMSPAWAELNSFMFTHNWWHLALFEIASGNTDDALRIYDDYCWDVEPEYSQDQIGAVSLLARLEIAGVDVGNRWQALSAFLESRASDVIQPFLTLQYLYGLARTGSNAGKALLGEIKRQASEPAVSQDKTLWNEVGIELAEGVYAHGTGDYALAAAKLSTLRQSIWRIGGSHAQRDLFEQLLLDALWKSGQQEKAEKMMVKRLQWEPDNPLLHSRLNLNP